VPRAPNVGPLGVVGLDTVSIETVKAGDQDEIIDECCEHRALTLIEKLPLDVHECERLIVPTGSHSELVPSPQSKKYWIECPTFEEEPPVE
jgi:hypothetical protein